MTHQHIVLTGATGKIGSQLAHILLAQGYRVTAVARPSQRLDALQQAGAEAASGDLHDVAFLTKTLREADAAFLITPPNTSASDVLADMRQVGDAIAQAVQASGLRRAVNLSSARADQPANNGPVFLEREIQLNAIEGLTVAHLRPAFFMENLLANVGTIKRMGVVGSAMRPDLSLPMVAIKDIAARAAELLGGASFDNHSRHPLLGPRDYSMQDATAAIGQAIGQPELRYMQFPYEEAYAGMVKAGMSESMAGLYDEMIRISNQGKAAPSDARTAASTTPTTLEEFAQNVFAPAFNHAN